MSLVAFTFGSLGDIIALLQLADQVRKTLCDTRSASAEYRDLIAELDSVVYTITNVQRVLSIQGPCRLAQSVENALYHAVGVCLHLVAQMNERISTRRQAACGRGVVRMMVADVWQSIGWTLFKREEVLFLRKRLSGQVAAMNTLLMLTQSDQLDHVGNQVSRFHGEYLDESRRQYTLIQEIHRCVMNRPRAMGYTWEAAQNSDNMPIIFTDMLGHTVTLPWEFVGTNELLHEFLVFYFRNRPCRKLVEERQYFVANEDNQHFQTLNGGDDWQLHHSFQEGLQVWRIYWPGSRVNMHGVVNVQFCITRTESYPPRLPKVVSPYHLLPRADLQQICASIVSLIYRRYDEYSGALCYLYLGRLDSFGVFPKKPSEKSISRWLLHSLSRRDTVTGLPTKDVLGIMFSHVSYWWGGGLKREMLKI